MSRNFAVVDSRLRRWVPGRVAQVIVWAVFLTSAVFVVAGVPFTAGFGNRSRFDVDVYRLGGGLWQEGVSLYAEGSMPFTQDGIWLPFTYPPFAALLFAPLSKIPLPVVGVGLSLITAVLLVYLTRVFLGLLRIGGRHNRWYLALLITAVTMWFNPFYMTFGFGQINVVLMALVVADLFVLDWRGRRAPVRGVMIGLAAAIKLTPAVFALVFVASRRGLREVLLAAGTFLAAALVGWAWLPADSVKYWTYTLLHTGRIGDQAAANNQNLYGVWARLLSLSTATTVCWLISVLAVTTLAVLAAAALRPIEAFTPGGGAHRRVDAVLLACVVSVWGLLVSPTTWGHHWTWSLPAILACFAIGVRAGSRAHRYAYLALSLIGTAVFAVGPYEHLSPDVPHWSPVSHLVAGAFTWWGLALLAVVWLLPPRSAEARPAAD